MAQGSNIESYSAFNGPGVPVFAVVHAALEISTGFVNNYSTSFQ